MNGPGSVADPGWGAALGRIPWAFLSIFLPRRSAPGDGGTPPVVALRAAFLAYIGMLVAFLVVLVLILPPTVDDSPASATWIVAAGVLPLAMIPASRRRLVSFCGSPRELAQAYTTAFYLGVMFAESAALLGFVASFVAGAWWPYVVGVALSAVGFVIVAPTEERIRSVEDAMTRAGCQHSLREGLYSAAPSGPTD